MAMDLGRRGAAISSINVTPMADVIIVLLIIFMVTIPVIGRGEVDLPDALRGKERRGTPLSVTIHANGSIWLSDHGVVAPFELAARIRDQLEGENAVVRLHADEGLSYDRTAEVLAACREGGAEEVMVMTDEVGL
jgi:biopolymer transport protein ExbD